MSGGGWKAELRRAAWRAQGRADALGFAQEQHGDVETLTAALGNREATLADPGDALAELMTPDSSRRLWLEGYVEGLKEALGIIKCGH